MVRIGEVATFPDVKPDKEQAKKILEEAAEAFAAWQSWNDQKWSISRRTALLDECADVIQAVANMVAALGMDDFGEVMAACEARNRERGRL